MARAKQRTKLDLTGATLRQPLLGLPALGVGSPAATGPEPEPRPVDTPPESAGETSARGGRSVYGRAAKLVVRRERRGHGGKVATRIEGLMGSTIELETALREIKRALGCGASLDRGDVVVQGAHGERLIAFLAGSGARKVVVGS